MKNENLLVAGGLAKDVNASSFLTALEMNQWEQQVYPAIDKEIPDNKFNSLSEIFGEEFSKIWYAHRNELITAEDKARVKMVSVGEKQYIACFVFDVMHSGWECDATGWIVEDNGEKKLVLSNHGETYFAKKEELSQVMNGYKEVLEETQKAFDML